MIISVEEAKKFVETKDWSDEKIERKLMAIEQTIRAYTNNNFQDRGFRVRANIVSGVLVSDTLIPFSVGDTIQVTETQRNKGLFTVSNLLDGNSFVVNEEVHDEEDILITKVVYPADVIDCCVNLFDWERQNRAKVGIQSETLSRHSVTYFNQDAGNQVMGYPVSLLGCLKAYRKVRC